MAGEIGRSPLQRSNPADAAITPWGNSLTISDPELARSREKIDESKKIGISSSFR